VSYDASKLLVSSQFEKLWRRSGFSSFFVVDIASKQTTRVGTNSTMKQSSCTWSPTANKVACSENYNIILQDFTSSPSNVITVTTDGYQGVTIHGMQSWVYEEEVFESATAMWWSPSGSLLAFISFNETVVPTYSFPKYGDVNAYPYQRSVDIKYPLSGFPNPIPAVSIYNISGNSLSSMEISPDAEYVSYVGFKDEQTLGIRVLDRAQRLERLQLNPVSSGPLQLSTYPFFDSVCI
jgi:dipeptidyl aminopeptidase/acylaminoacyl peptidase